MANKGQKVPRISQALKGKPKSAEHRKNMSLVRIGEKNHMWIADREEKARREKINHRWRKLLKRTVYRAGTKKEKTTCEMLGYDADTLRKHIESLFLPGMSWENYGLKEGGWHIDHIRSVSTFPLDASPAEVNALSNLQPLWAKDNLSKWTK